jgi:hypothetical protein
VDEQAVLEVGACLLRPLPVEPFPTGCIAVVEGDDHAPAGPPSVGVDVIAYAVLADRCVTTGWDERLGLGFAVGTPERLLKRDVREFALGSGWWAALAYNLRQQAGVAVTARSLARRFSRVDYAAGLREELQIA